MRCKTKGDSMPTMTLTLQVIDRFVKNEQSANYSGEATPRKKMKISQSSILPLYEVFINFNGNPGTLLTNISGLQAFSLFNTK
uniref:Uncharacterized protein n=1 Tax=Romanomermis culicivorax TaxID=13658 RepID=A0A915KT74_ROMCU